MEIDGQRKISILKIHRKRKRSLGSIWFLGLIKLKKKKKEKKNPSLRKSRKLFLKCDKIRG